MNKFWNNLKYWFSEEYRLCNHKIYIRLCFHKIWKDWRKCKKMFMKPQLIVYEGDLAEREFDYYMDLTADSKAFENKWFGLHVEELGWKRKWGYLEFTHCPEIVCIVNKKVLFTIRLESPIAENNPIANRLYWEAILNYLYDHRTNLVQSENKYYLVADKDLDNEKKYYPIDPSLVPVLNKNIIYSAPQIEG